MSDINENKTEDSSVDSSNDYARFYTTDPFYSMDDKSNQSVENMDLKTEESKTEDFKSEEFKSEESVKVAETEDNIDVTDTLSDDNKSDAYSSYYSPKSDYDSVYISKDSGSVYMSKETPSSKVDTSIPTSLGGSQSYSTDTVSSSTAPASAGINTLAILSLIFGIVGILCNLFSLFIFNIAAIVLAVIYLCIKDDKKKTHNSMAVWGLILGIVGLILGIAFVIFCYKIDSTEDVLNTPVDILGDEHIINKDMDRDNKESYIPDIEKPDTEDPHPLDSGISTESSDEIINDYIKFFLSVGKNNGLEEDDIIYSTFDTSSSNGLVITLYGYPGDKSFLSSTICHYYDKELYPYIAEETMRDKCEVLSMFGDNITYKGLIKDDYAIYTSDAKEGYIYFYGINDGKCLTYEACFRYDSPETKTEILNTLAGYSKEIDWPVIK